jgi:hypothetical protein
MRKDRLLFINLIFIFSTQKIRTYPVNDFLHNEILLLFQWNNNHNNIIYEILAEFNFLMYYAENLFNK